MCTLILYHRPGHDWPLLLAADRRTACWLCHRGEKPSAGIEAHALPSSLTLFTDRDPNDTQVPRIQSYLPRFRDLPAPDPESAGGWSAWSALLSSRVDLQPVWLFAIGHPDRMTYEPVSL